MKKVVIIGGGPAGLTAAYELLAQNAGYEVTVVEASKDLGGISKTINVNGNRIDIGGHRFFSKDRRVTDWWAHLLTPQGKPSKDDILHKRDKEFMPGGADPETDDLVMLTRERVSRIYYKNLLFDYPVTLSLNTICNMGLHQTIRTGFSYLATLFRKLPECDLENFYINRFGKVLYAMFFESYTEKIWGRHPREISAEWGVQRVKGLSIKAVLEDIFSKILQIKKRKVETSLIERFSYPKYGPGQLWTVAADKVQRMGGMILTNKCVIRIERDENGQASKVICTDGSEFPCNVLISSMPIKDLVCALNNAPSDAIRISEGLHYRDFQTVGALIPVEEFLLRKNVEKTSIVNITPDCWIYVQDTSVLLGRIQVFNNWSPYMVKDFEHQVWIGLEYFCDAGDKYWEMSDSEFIKFAVNELVKLGVIASASVVQDAHRERIMKAYPAYWGTYAEFDTLRAFLDSISNLYCVGRNGQHRYNNMDHSMATAFETVDTIISGRKDKDSIWNVNTELVYHEKVEDRKMESNGK